VLLKPKLIAIAGCGLSLAVSPAAARADWPTVGSFSGPLGAAEIAVDAHGDQAVLVRVPGGDLRLATRRADGASFGAPTPLGHPVPNTRTDLAVVGGRAYVLSAGRAAGLALRSVPVNPASVRIVTTRLSRRVVTSASMTATSHGLSILAATCPVTRDAAVTGTCRGGRLSLFEYDIAHKALRSRTVADGGTFGPVELDSDGHRRVAAVWARRTRGKRFQVFAAHATGSTITRAVDIGSSRSPVQVTSSIAHTGAALAGWVDVSGSQCGPSTPTTFFLAASSGRAFGPARRFASWDDEECGGGVRGLALAVQVFDDGSGRVIWTDQPAGTYTVQTALVAHGTVGPHELVSAPEVNSQLLSVAARPDGTLGVLWYGEEAPRPSLQTLYATAIPPKASAGPRPPPEVVTSALEGPTASLAWTPQGKLVAALDADLRIEERRQP
jgi:hypothetical protein